MKKESIKLLQGFRAIMSLLFVMAIANKSTAAISVTAGTGGTNICTNKAVDGSASAFTTLGNITVAEGSTTKGDLGNTSGAWTVTVTYAAPAGWQFNTSTAPTYSFTASQNITGVSGTFTSGNLVVTITGSGQNKNDNFTIIGLQVKATTSASNGSFSASGYIYASASTGTITGLTTSASGTNFGDLSQGPQNITGTNTVCSLATVSLSDVTSGGTWASGSSSTASVGTNGVVTGGSAGTASITYTVGGCATWRTVTVNAIPSISNNLGLCAGGATNTLTAAPSGGTWLSTNTSIATINSGSGLMTTGSTAGNSTISYTATTGCVTTVQATVNANPTAFSVTGGGSYCSGGSGVTVGLGGSQTTANYQLYRGTTAVGSPVSGTGSSLAFGLQTSAGTYTVKATNATTSCTGNMTGSTTVNVNSNPSVFTVTGGGSFCSGGAGMSVGLVGSQSGVNYQLYNGSSASGSPVAGTGSALTFGLQTSAGTYSVSAVNASTSCVADMAGDASVSVNANPTAFSVTGGGSYCAGGSGIDVGLGGSQAGINYQLYNGSSTVGSPVAGTGSALDFGTYTSAGTYSVHAVNAGTSCAANMTGNASLNINANPTVFSVTGGGSYCSGGSGVGVGLGGSQTGINYQLYNGSSSVGSLVAGTGSSLNFGLQTSAGTYSVSAVNASTSCAADMAGDASVSINANPTAFAVTGGGSYCAGGSGVDVGLGGSQTGVNYQLYNGLSTVGSPVAGTGSALNFGSYTSAGIYSVSAVIASTSCTANMTGNASVSINANPTAFSVTGGGSYCSGGSGVGVGLGGSQTGINYQLYNGSSTVGSPVAGTGSALNFGSYTSAGSYSVSAVNTSTSCVGNMTGNVTVSINSNPTAFSVTGGGSYCSGGSGVGVGLGGSQTGVNYQLYNGSSAAGSPVAGTGSSLNFGLKTSAGTYTVMATNASTSCAADMTGDASVSINTNPTTFSVSGGGSYCSGGSGVGVGLGGSQTGVNYQLYNGSSSVGSPVAGTGSSLNFGSYTSAGTYSVSAVNASTSCASDMTGNASVSINANPTAFSVTGGGSYCAGGSGVGVGLGGSQTGINYQLYNGSSAVGSPIAGTGSALNFGSYTSAGTYSVNAVNASTSCAANMTGDASVSINANPTAFSVTGGGSYCAGGSGVDVGLGGSQTGINYQLYNGSSSVGSPVAGTGSSLDFGSFTPSGTYSVNAVNASTSCTSDMTGNASVSVNSNPTAYAVTGGGSYCAGGSGVGVGLGGSQTGVNYQLYNGSSTVGSLVAGTGSSLNFGSYTSVGTYSVNAVNASTSCAANMTGNASVSINANPTAFSVTGGGSYCAGGDGVEVGLGGSQTGVNYQLHNGSSTVGSLVAGTGSALNFGSFTSAGTYSVSAVNASTSCAADMTSNASVSINANPTAYSVTGGGSYCSGGSGVGVGLGGSQTGINYQLYNGSSAVGSLVAGTGSALNFGSYTSAGTYSVSAVNFSTSCAANMTGNASVSINANPTAFSVTGGGSYCSGGSGVGVGLGGSQTGINYQLYNGSSTVGSPIAGTGSALNFGSYTSAGTYSVNAVNASTSCAANMTGDASVSINANPTAFSVTGGGSYCSGGSGVGVGLGGSQTGVNYQLYNGSSTVGSPVAGTGSALNLGSYTSAGTYSINAVNASTSCAADMTGDASVSINANPTAYAVTGGGSYCSGGSGIGIGLGGSQTGINYQLYNGSSTVGSPVAGTGSALNFGLQTSTGSYSVSAVNASTSCVGNMTGSVTISVNSNPTTFSVTGGGSYCAGGDGVELGLGGSQSGVNYQLYNGSSAVGSPVAGTGSALNFGLFTSAGTYSVSAVNATTSCTADMASTATVIINSNPTAFSVTGGGSYCDGGTGVSVGLGGSQTGVDYQLFNGTSAVGGPIEGTGSALNFGLYTSAGTYSVNASDATTSCATDMTSTATVSVNSNPTAYAATGGGAYCDGGAGVSVGLGGSQTGVNYQLYNGSSTVGSPVAGTGSALNFGLQTSEGTYSVGASDASTSCASDMTGDVTVSINANPTAYEVGGGGAYCSGGAGVSIGLGGSETGVNYQLYRGASAIGSPVAGTGFGLEFGPQTAAGTYSVAAINGSTSCATNMTGDVAVSINANPTVFTVAGGGAYCDGGLGVSVGLGGSQTGVDYQLYNGSSAVGSPVAGTGSALEFGPQTIAGTYSVGATDASTSCVANMTDDATVSINANPTAFSVTGGGSYCAGGSGVGVGLGGSQTGINYQLYNGSSTVGSPVAGTGSALNFGSYTSAGTYSVNAVNASTSCAADMTSDASVNINANPTAYAVSGGGSYCAGGIGVNVGLGGSQTGVNYQLYNGSSAVGSPVAGTGSTLNFGSYTSAGTYSVNAVNVSTSCTADMTGDASVSINANPTAYTVTGGGAYCDGGTGVGIGLGGSQTGVDYQLYNGSSAVGSLVAGTGSALEFGLQTSEGTYSVGASDASTSCMADMTSTATISINSNPTAYAVTGGGSYCAGGSGVGVGLGGSQTGVNYQLYNGSSAVGSLVAGTGSSLNFGSYTSSGTYSVNAVNASTSCVADMTGDASVSINANPTAFSVTGGGSYCAGGSGVGVGLGGSQTGVNYQLYNGSSAVGSTVAGTGSALNFGSYTSAGTYSVSAVNAGTSCASDMTGDASVSINANPTAYAVTGGGSYCSGGSGVGVGLGGSETGINYQLYNGSSTVGSPIAGTGSALNFGLFTSEGTYSVSAVNVSTSCAADMTGDASVSINANPTAYAVTGGGSYCAGGSGVGVGLGGSQTGVNYQLYNGSSAVGSLVAGTGSALNFGSYTSAGTYSVSAVIAGTSCAADMTGDASVSINVNPTAFSVTGGGSYCAGGSGVGVGLGGSQTGINYQLYNGSSTVGTLVAGTGSALNFGSYTSAGTYSVNAVNASTSCAANMTGNASVSINANPTAFSVTGGGSYCSGGSGVGVGLGGSQTGVNYQLYNGSSTVGSPVAGTGSSLSFGLQTSTGSYSVSAVNASTSCVGNMTGSVTISVNSNPTAFSVTGGGSYCAGGSGVGVGLGGSQTGVNYQLYNGLSSVGSPVAGTGSALNFGSYTSAGTYSVSAVNASTSCAADMTGNASVSINANPTAYSVSGGGSYCAGGSGVGVGLSGSQTGVNYQLYNGSSVVGSPVAGTGSSLNFGSYTSAGSYSVSAVNTSTSCVGNMTGSVTVSINSNPTAFSVTGGGSYCSGGSGVGVGLGGSQTGVNYQLYNGSSTVGIPVAGTGSALNFGSYTSAGSYSVAAVTAGTSCAADMTGDASVSINANPTAFTIAGGGSYCAGGTGVEIGLGGSQTGVNYQLYNGSSATGSPVSGTGSALNFGSYTSAGTYSVGAVNTSTSCAADMTGETSVNVISMPDAGTITGVSAVCQSNMTTLSNLVGAGTWSSSAVAIATVGSGGVVSGISAGTATISYAVTNSCGSTVATKIVTINPAPNAGAITGAASVCEGNTTMLSNSVSGGAWSSGAAGVASVTSSGVVSGVMAGMATISYAVSNGCGVASVTKVVTVNSAPNAGTIAGSSTVSVGGAITLSNAVSGGAWSSGSTGVASVNSVGVVAGVTTGTAMISYTVTNGCGTAVATKLLAVNPVGVLSITGSQTVCVGTTISQSASAVGGTWSSSNTAKATVSAAGVVTGVAIGTAIITYNISGDFTTVIVTVNATLASISGAASACPGTTTSLSNATTGGTWSSSNPTIATVNATSGVVTGIVAGTTTIVYTISGGCSKSSVVTVNANPIISGSPEVCVGKVTGLSITSAASSWSSSNTAIATVSSGAVTGVAGGTADITVTAGTGCKAVVNVLVKGLPPAISGTLATCIGSSTTLSNAMPGGTWSSYAPGYASISSSGVVTGLVASNVIITYTSAGGCIRTGVVTVNAAPVIMGTASMCVGSSATLVISGGGSGTWSSGAVSRAIVGPTGIVTGVSAGSAPISFTAGIGCVATAVAIVNVTPDAISGPSTVCAGRTITLSNGLAGGTWSSSSYATIGTAGNVTGIIAGPVAISYTVGNCRATRVLTVLATPPVIGVTGSASICEGATTLLSNAWGGTWSTLHPAITTVSVGGVVTGIAAGNGTIVFTAVNGCQSTKVVTVNVCSSRQAITGIANSELNAHLTIFPNPTNGLITIQAPEAGTLSVIAVDGKEVASYRVAEGETNIVLPNDLAIGVYMCRFNGHEGNSAMVRLIYQP